MDNYPVIIDLPSELTIRNTQEFMQSIAANLSSGADISVQSQNVNEVDACGAQALAAILLDFKRPNRVGTGVLQMSPAVEDALSRLGILDPYDCAVDRSDSEIRGVSRLTETH